MDLSDIHFVKRITIGNTDPDVSPSEADNEAAIELLNRCLADTPRGCILGVEKASATRGSGDQQVVAQSVTYHVGWPRKPSWLRD